VPIASPLAYQSVPGEYLARLRMATLREHQRRGRSMSHEVFSRDIFRVSPPASRSTSQFVLGAELQDVEETSGPEQHSTLDGDASVQFAVDVDPVPSTPLLVPEYVTTPAAAPSAASQPIRKLVPDSPTISVSSLIDDETDARIRTLIRTNERLSQTNALLVERLAMEKQWFAPPAVATVRDGLNNAFSRMTEQDNTFGTGSNVETDEMVGFDTAGGHKQNVTPGSGRKSRTVDQAANDGGLEEGELSNSNKVDVHDSFTRKIAKAIVRRPDQNAASIGQSGRRGWPWLRSILVSGLISFIGVGLLSLVHLLANEIDETLILGSFGAEAVLLFAAPYSPFSQPRNVIGSHVLGFMVGMMFRDVAFTLAAPLAVSFTIMLTMATDTIHPPAGGLALIVVSNAARIRGLGWKLAMPVFLSVCLLLCAAMLNNLFVCCTAKRKYPTGGTRKLYCW
jgi:CBS domain-containing membrane protein